VNPSEAPPFTLDEVIDAIHRIEKGHEKDMIAIADRLRELSGVGGLLERETAARKEEEARLWTVLHLWERATRNR
jgi:hypothetical protein